MNLIVLYFQAQYGNSAQVDGCYRYFSFLDQAIASIMFVKSGYSVLPRSHTCYITRTRVYLHIGLQGFKRILIDYIIAI